VSRFHHKEPNQLIYDQFAISGPIFRIIGTLSPETWRIYTRYFTFKAMFEYKVFLEF
jgi:hypothetical protein